MSIKKQFLKSKDLYKVTWSVAKQEAQGAETINLVGDFNNWNLEEHNFTKLKSGAFKITLELEKDKEYQFRYYADGQTWFNDSSADGFINNDVSNETNCVLSLT